MTEPALDAREAWNFGADGYIRFVESGADVYRLLVHGPALLKACGDLRGARTLDIGCGHGYFSRLLAKSGAETTGIDLSDRLIAEAGEMEAAEPLGIAYSRMDAAEIGSRFQPERFDLATGCMSLQDIADPAAVLQGAYRVLKPEGRFVFSILHPCGDPPVREWKRDERGAKIILCLDRYFDSGPAICDWRMPSLPYPWRTPYHRRTLTEWSRLVRDAGFVIRELSEPRPSPELVDACPALDDCARMPYFLIFELEKTKTKTKTKTNA